MAHGGGFNSDTRAGAIWNVVICGIICIAAPITAIVNAHRGAEYVGFGIAVTVLALGMEAYFIRRLLAHRR
ncbi:hypothetical protein [Curtobacterium aurantiacum]|uniref:hypothetical protein n=1 Tax=Curtobacterium aurantiacum TaxID=3236919 RepID=UPI001BE06711|nr:hypothetical protein [Curtobacterium flaccumfaciens]MBT1676303.1 hypothetical protein [Curtobacterium flaccumfaciens pv. flaccumfaciens]